MGVHVCMICFHSCMKDIHMYVCTYSMFVFHMYVCYAPVHVCDVFLTVHSFVCTYLKTSSNFVTCTDCVWWATPCTEKPHTPV